MRRPPAVLVLADGTTFEGEAIGSLPEVGVGSGEFVFNTTLSGYQEVISDPSYAGQVVTFTATQIGNYGVTGDDDEARRPACSGIVVRDYAERPSNWRAEQTLDDWLIAHGVPGIAGVDTRRLTRVLRTNGSMPGAFALDVESARAAAGEACSTDGIDLVATVTTPVPYLVPQGSLVNAVAHMGGLAAAGSAEVAGLTAPGSTRTPGARQIVAYDFGIKRNILTNLAQLGDITVVPASTPAADVLAMAPHGVFLSNGPGDPSAVADATEAITGLLDQVPIFGICLGHQLLGRALGARTVKLDFGHHGGNHPVKDLETGRIEITSQNHNYAVDADSITSAEVSHVNLNDGVVEGLRCTEIPAFTVQHHPEASPGPHDSRYLFDRFADLMERTA